jgi:Fic family protein
MPPFKCVTTRLPLMIFCRARARAERHALFTVQFVQDLHRAVMKGDADYQDVPGELRKIVAWIGGAGHIANSIYNPTPPDDIPACLAETMTYMRCEGLQAMAQSLIVRMSVAHSHFEAVHPFRDGNGRVDRLLLPLMMAAEGLTPIYLSPYIEAHKQAPDLNRHMAKNSPYSSWHAALSRGRRGLKRALMFNSGGGHG